MRKAKNFLVDLVVEFNRDGVMNIAVRRIITHPRFQEAFESNLYYRLLDIFENHIKHNGLMTEAQMVDVMERKLAEYPLASNGVRNFILKG
jgi:hypothetical protein